MADRNSLASGVALVTETRVLDVWEAVGRFSRRRLGVEPQTLFRAWGFASVAEFDDLLARYPSLVPREDKVAECVSYLEATWVEHFGST